ncbi:MAG: serine acetyltransferase [Phycisphaerae bacterium]|nr:serine acetyltransferase [Phycisphaerae bacterium]NUQ45276.1 serine acetyltransferase [Phycisphaerae bacterium]
MLGEFDLGGRLGPLVQRIVASFERHERIRHVNRGFMPSRSEMIEVTRLLLELTYPGYFGRQDLDSTSVVYHVGELLPRLGQKLFFQIFRSLCYQNEVDGHYDPAGSEEQAMPFHYRARDLTVQFLEQIPEIREMLAQDVDAAYDGDPAATNTDEIIVAYPGVMAVSVYRYAHALHRTNVPLLPRIMSEWIHGVTGIDIHPGARIGRRFFIDHGTGVVIGETADIGDNVKIYQGVTLGALSFLKDERGRMVRGYKRHPTVQDGVTLYANAIVLGGDTVLGENSVIGGSTFITSSIPPNTVVSIKPPELKVRPARNAAPAEAQAVVDFSI